MTAYLVVEAKLTDPERFMAYAQAVPQLVAQFGGEYLVLGGDPEVLEGEWSGAKIVIHVWPDKCSAKKFWSSAEYQRVKKLRLGTGEFKVMLVDGLDRETLE